MRLSDFLGSWEGTRLENQAHRKSNLLLVFSNILLAIALIRSDVTVRLAPTPLEGEAKIASDSASENLKISWGLYITTLIGNVTPKNAKFLSDALAPNLSPKIYRDVVSAVESQAKQVAEEQLTISFQPGNAFWEPAKSRVIVSGELVTSGVRGESHREPRTYELGFVVQNYRVLLDTIDFYPGPYKPDQARS